MHYPSLYPVAAETKLSTLIDLLRFRSLSEPTLTAYRFLADEATGESSITYAALDLRARAVAALLQSRGWRGERVLLLYAPGLEFIAAFFGCLYAGAVAVPLSLPQTKRGFGRVQAIATDAQAAGALTTRRYLARAERLPCEWLTSDDLSHDEAVQWREPSLDSKALAYLQYTSGSTSTPKGVMVTHANVLANSAYIQHGFEHGPQSVSLSWLPHFHDMGLVDGIIQPLYSGFTGLLMSPAALLQDPARWLQAISRFRVTHSGGPNFAYDLCVRRIDESKRASLDLSTWSVAYNGAEPVRRETLERFVAAFAPCGFRPTAFYPAYGLAEATLKVAGGRRGVGPVYRTVSRPALEQHRVVPAQTDAPDSQTLVGCGRGTLGTEVVIVNPESLRVCELDEVGEVWVSGPGVGAGYWNRPDETESTFNARLAQSRYLRTGDLGFVRDGELFITGRLKDLIIIRGRNHYPQDIERAVYSSHLALQPDSGAAFSVELENEERLVVVYEIDTRYKHEAPAIVDTIRAAITEEFEIQPAAVVLIRSGTLLKTSSGKVRRGACREGYLKNSLSVIAEWNAAGERKTSPPAAPDELNAETVERWLRLLLSTRLNVAGPLIDARQPIARYGIDSLLALELTHSVETSLGVRLSSTSFLRNPTIAELTSEILACAETSATATQPAVMDQGGEHPLSHGQQALWAIQNVSPESTAYNVLVAARIRGEVDTRALQRTFSVLLQRHSMLRARFPSRDGVPVCVIQEDAERSFHFEDATDCTEDALRDRLRSEAWTSFDLERGPLLRANLFKRSAHEYVIMLSAHHIIVDYWSLAILLRELAALYEAEVEGRPAHCPTRPSYSAYVRRQSEMLAGPEGERLRKYWVQQLAGELPVLDLPADHARPPVQGYRGASVSARLDRQLTQRLKKLALSHEATLFMTLLAAFYVLLYRYTDQEEILVGSPAAGRGLAEFAGTIGYFVNPLVLRARLSGDRSFSDLLADTRQTTLAAFEHQDYPFDLLVRQLQPERDPA
ncbi:MAG TPA: condensation domain-containing protein, partial [Pyrinomonadaceae bacterium]|nr:condensation domain-containing protein [Pyrinomonadaceae bacterium]